MRQFLTLSLLSLILFRCDNFKKEKPQKRFYSFDFSYNDVFLTCFSIKFTQSDTVFIRQHFASSFSNKIKSNTSYYAILSSNDRNRLDSFIKKTEFLNYDSLYYQSYEDGIDYQFYFNNDTIQKLIRIHSNNPPVQLSSFMEWIVTTKENIQLHFLDSTINFSSSKNFLPPKVSAPPIKRE